MQSMQKFHESWHGMYKNPVVTAIAHCVCQKPFASSTAINPPWLDPGCAGTHLIGKVAFFVG